MKFFSIVIAFLCAFPDILVAQDTKEPEVLLSKESLMPFFPEKFGGFTFKDVSEVPAFSTPRKGRFLNGYYGSDSKDYGYFIQLAHYRNAKALENMSLANWKGGLLDKSVEKSEYQGFTSYAQADPARKGVYIGDDFEVVVYPAKDDGNLEEVRAALEEVDLLGLKELLDKKHQTLMKTKEPAPEKKPAFLTEKTGKPVTFKTFECSSLNPGLEEEMKKQMGGELVPWIHFLREKEASEATVEGDYMMFPKEGNDWLQCVKENDILWSPMEMPMFMKRVKKNTTKADRVIFKTENAGFKDVIMKGRVEMEAGGASDTIEPDKERRK